MDKEQLNKLILRLQKAGILPDGCPIKVKVHHIDTLGRAHELEPERVPESILERIMDNIQFKFGAHEEINAFHELFSPFKEALQGHKTGQKEASNTSKDSHTTLSETEKEQIKCTLLNLASNGQITELTETANELCKAVLAVKNF